MIKKSLLCSCLILICSCSGTDDNGAGECYGAVGNLTAKLDDSLMFESRSTTFYFPQDSIVSVVTYEVNGFCSLIGSVSFVLDKKRGDHQLQVSDRDGREEAGETVFIQWDDDVVLGRFALYKEEPHWLKVTSLSEERVEGVFSATYVFDPGPYRFITLPDTKVQ